MLPPEARVLRLAVWHHPVTGNGKIQDTAFMERLLCMAMSVRIAPTS
jgi:hypothetical protein